MEYITVKLTEDQLQYLIVGLATELTDPDIVVVNEGFHTRLLNKLKQAKGKQRIACPTRVHPQSYDCTGESHELAQAK